MAKFEGIYEAFRYTPLAALDANSIVKVGALLGVTRAKCAANDTIMAFMACPRQVYSFPLATDPAVAAIARGTLVTIDASGKIKAAGAGDNAIGTLWEDVAVGDSEALVMIATDITPDPDDSSSSKSGSGT